MISPTPKVLTEADLAGLPRAVSHTPGKLIVRGGFSLYAEDRKTPVADACLNASIAAHDECNARRLAACWNALEGVPTEEIETVLIHGKALKDVASERDALAGRVAELEAALKPNLFWNDADPEHGETSIFEVIDSEWNGGCMKHGDEMVIQQAVRLPNIRVRLIPCPTDGDDYFDYEVIDAALSATTPESKP